MGWQASDDWPGRMPGRDSGLPGLLAGFGHGGAWEAAAPSAALAAALEAVAGPDGVYAGADTDTLTGMVRQWAAIESWAAAGMFGALRAMMREDGTGAPLLRRRSDLPDGWDDSLNYEVAAALAMGPVSAGNLAHLAWTLGMRLPGIGRLLADGILTRSKARLVAQIFEPLDEQEAARAEALVLGELAGKTYLQVERLAWRAALAVAPDVAERRRAAAERTQARVTVFREEAGTVGLSGRDLPAAEALSGHANVVARAAAYEASGAFPDHTTRGLQALAYLDLLNGVPAADRIAFAAADRPEPPEEPGPHAAERGGGPQPSGEGGGEPGPDPGDDGDGAEGRETTAIPGTPPVPLVEVTVPLATLQRRTERAGDNRLLGPLDPALTRDLAAAAARSPHSRWEVIIVDERGYAVGHGIARPAPGRTGRPQPPGSRLRPDISPGRGRGQRPAVSALPARVNITVTESLLHLLTAQAAQPRPGAPPGDWELTPGKPGTWTLTVPGGRQLVVRFDTVPTHECDHSHRVSSYQPSERLRRLVQVRDHECTFPTCSRAARESDFEHAVPYDKGGITDACNAGARSRRCHQVKQSRGWTVTQPRPGWHQWQTPTGRTYTQEPWRYTA